VRYSGPVRLKLEEGFSTAKHHVVRCRVLESPSDSGPATVIVKRVKEDWSVGPYNCSHALLNDWAAAAFLPDLPGHLPLGPTRCHGRTDRPPRHKPASFALAWGWPAWCPARALRPVEKGRARAAVVCDDSRARCSLLLKSGRPSPECAVGVPKEVRS